MPPVRFLLWNWPYFVCLFGASAFIICGHAGFDHAALAILLAGATAFLLARRKALDTLAMIVLGVGMFPSILPVELDPQGRMILVLGGGVAAFFALMRPHRFSDRTHAHPHDIFAPDDPSSEREDDREHGHGELCVNELIVGLAVTGVAVWSRELWVLALAWLFISFVLLRAGLLAHALAVAAALLLLGPMFEPAWLTLPVALPAAGLAFAAAVWTARSRPHATRRQLNHSAAAGSDPLDLHEGAAAALGR